ncbi:MAG: histidine phosphatase family protein [Betaproteobacteria bacterium]|nr:histidine phosphatase family protein [Betaproteobacteria bacterium]
MAYPGADFARRRIYLVRHGDVAYFDADGRPLDPRRVGLSAAGREEVEALAMVLRGAPIDRAVCSGMPRARQTAEVLLAGKFPGIEDEPDFREIRAGRLREIPGAERERVVARAYQEAQAEGARFIGGETFAEFQARVLRAFDKLLADESWTTLLIASHDGVNRVVLGWAMDIGLAALPALEQDTACLNIIDVDWKDRKPVRKLVRMVNFTAHDAAKRHLYLTGMERIYLAYRAD